MLSAPSSLAGYFQILKHTVTLSTTDSIILPRSNDRVYLQFMPVGAVSPGFVYIGIDNSDITQGAWVLNQSTGFLLKWSDAGAMVGAEWHGQCTGGAWPMSVVEVRYNPVARGAYRENDGNRRKLVNSRSVGKPVASVYTKQPKGGNNCDCNH